MGQKLLGLHALVQRTYAILGRRTQTKSDTTTTATSSAGAASDLHVGRSEASGGLGGSQMPQHHLGAKPFFLQRTLLPWSSWQNPNPKRKWGAWKGQIGGLNLAPIT